MTTPVWYIFGAGGLGVETMDILQRAIAAGREPEHHCAFLVDQPQKREEIGFPVVAFDARQPGARVTIAVGEPAARRTLRVRLREAALELASVVSPDAVVSPSAQIASGVIVAPHCSIQARSTIEENVAVNTMAVVGHDVVVDADSVISSMVNLGGAMRVGACSYIGMGALLKERVAVGQESIVGMGSVVHGDIPDGVIAMGNPARVVRRNEDMVVFRA